MYKETVNYYLEVLFTRIDEKIDSYQKDISQKLEELKVDVMSNYLETLRQDELTSRPQTLAELEERIEKLESYEIDQNNRFETRYEFLNSRLNIISIGVGILVTGILVTILMMT